MYHAENGILIALGTFVVYEPQKLIRIGLWGIMQNYSIAIQGLSGDSLTIMHLFRPLLSRFLSSPVIMRVHFFLQFGFDRAKGEYSGT